MCNLHHSQTHSVSMCSHKDNSINIKTKGLWLLLWCKWNCWESSCQHESWTFRTDNFQSVWSSDLSQLLNIPFLYLINYTNATISFPQSYTLRKGQHCHSSSKQSGCSSTHPQNLVKTNAGEKMSFPIRQMEGPQVGLCKVSHMRRIASFSRNYSEGLRSELCRNAFIHLWKRIPFIFNKFINKTSNFFLNSNWAVPNYCINYCLPVNTFSEGLFFSDSFPIKLFRWKEHCRSNGRPLQFIYPGKLSMAGTNTMMSKEHRTMLAANLQQETALKEEENILPGGKT